MIGNFIHGGSVAAADGRTTELIDPSTREAYATAPLSDRADLDGKAPVIVFDDADIALAAEGIATAGYFNAGQDCTAATRVLAGPRVHEDFVAALEQQALQTFGDEDDALAWANGVPYGLASSV